jgi:hypothetical protein
MKKLIYLVLVSIDVSKHDDWLQWMQCVHIPEVLATGRFLDGSGTMVRLDCEEAEPKFISYFIRYYPKSREAMNLYREKEGPMLKEKHTERYDGHFTVRRFVGEIIENSAESKPNIPLYELALYVYDKLDQERASEIEQHIREDELNRECVESIQKDKDAGKTLDAVLDEIKTLPPSPSFDEMMKKVDYYLQLRRSGRLN